MIDARCVPIAKPLRGPKPPRRSPFAKQPWSKTLDLLERELKHLGARDVLIQLDLSRDDIRNDGWPRSTAKTRTPGVILSFESKVGPISMPCCTFDRWECNIRAIALALEALRKVDRYGVTRNAEQYRGWRALPEGGSAIAAAEWATAEDAARFLHGLTGEMELSWTISDICSSPAALTDVWKKAARKAHPDAGGSDELMSKVNRAKDFIERGWLR